MQPCILQDGHPIDDITWMRYRKKESALKVRHANEDDTGVYTCKGINGFGSAEARVEVIVVGEFTGPEKMDCKMVINTTQASLGSLATAVANFTKPRTSHFFDLCTYKACLILDRTGV